MKRARVSPLARHRFEIGTMVRLGQVGPAAFSRRDVYEVVAQLPECDGQLQYRLKCSGEQWQRIAKENELQPV